MWQCWTVGVSYQPSTLMPRLLDGLGVIARADAAVAEDVVLKALVQLRRALAHRLLHV